MINENDTNQKHKTTRVHLKPSDVVAAIERIKKRTTNKPITHVYLVICENDVDGAWTDPEEAVRHEFNYDLRETGGIRLNHIDRILTVKEAVEEMLKPNSSYPYLKKVEINPANIDADL